MSITLLFFASFILYGKSKYFPEHLNTIGKIIKDKKQIINIISSLFLLLSYILLGNKYGWGTGFVIFLIALSFMYPLLLMVLSLHKKYVYIISTLCVLLIIIFESNI